MMEPTMAQCSTNNLEFQYTRLTLSRKITWTLKKGHAQNGDKPKVFIQASDSKLILLLRNCFNPSSKLQIGSVLF